MKTFRANNEEDIQLLLVITRGAKSRQKIIKAVSSRPKNCNQIANEVKLEWWTVQKHLQLLTSKGIIEKLNMGRITFYKVAPNCSKILKDIMKK